MSSSVKTPLYKTDRHIPSKRMTCKIVLVVFCCTGWTPSRLGGGSRTGVRHTVARRLNVDQALKGAGPLGSGLAPLTVPQNLPSGCTSLNFMTLRWFRVCELEML